MELLDKDVLFYNVCYSEYSVAITFSYLCMGYNGEHRNINTYFLTYVKNINEDGNLQKYWINKFTGLREGIYKKYNTEHDNFPMVQCMFVNGELHGLYQEWYLINDERILKTECNYQEGILHGEFKEYYKNGVLMIQCNHNYGELHGLFYEYNDNGNLYHQNLYDNGKMLCQRDGNGNELGTIDAILENKERQYRWDNMEPLCSTQVSLHYFHEGISGDKFTIFITGKERRLLQQTYTS